MDSIAVLIKFGLWRPVWEQRICSYENRREAAIPAAIHNKNLMINFKTKKEI